MADTVQNRNGYFLSDLHLQSNRSSFERYADQIRSASENAHTMILGGDIFDFKWSRHRSIRKSIELALTWVDDLVSRYPNCLFVYLLGNHDSHPDFVAGLDELTFRRRNLDWKPHFIRIENCVFLHGDVIDGGLDHTLTDAWRRAHDEHALPSAYRHWLYDVAVQIRLHRVIGDWARPHSWVLKKLTRYLEEQALTTSQGITDVYFGHTHREMDSVFYDGLKFHNGGACIKGIPFRIVKTCLKDPVTLS